jgi:hypothetical protein
MKGVETTRDGCSRRAATIPRGEKEKLVRLKALIQLYSSSPHIHNNNRKPPLS